MSDTQRIEYEECFVAYLDILGFKEKVKETKKSPESLNKLIEVLKINSTFTQSSGKETTSDGKIDIRSFFFSDSFVSMMKAEKKNMRHLFLIVRYLQDKLWEDDLCLRGAVVKGKMYWPKHRENIVLGPAMIKAHGLESKVAIYPRIIVSQELYEYIESEKIRTWSENGDTPLSDFIKKDKDGVYFFDILNPHIKRKKREHIKRNKESFIIRWDADDENNYEHVISYVNKAIENGINSENEEVRQKYEWLRSYLEESQGNR